jgi:hypothetical protein
MDRLWLGALPGFHAPAKHSASWRDKLKFPSARCDWNTLLGRRPMKIEKYLLLVLVVFFLIVLGTYLHKMIH